MSETDEAMLKVLNVLVKHKVPPQIDEIRQLQMDKDGTAYELLAFHLKGKVCCGSLGCVEDGWLVIEGLHRKAYLFQEKGFLDTGYVFDKLCRAGYDLSITDARNITALLSVAIDRPANPF